MGWQDDQIVGQGSPPAAAPPAGSWQSDQVVAPDFAAYAKQQAAQDEQINQTGPWNVAGAARQVGQGLTLGYADEAEALARSAMGQNYNQQLTRIRQSNADFERRNPGASLVSQFAGALPTAILAPEARLAEFAGWSAAPATTLAGRSMRAAGTGAGYGTVAGYGSGEGGVENRAENAVHGAEVGGMLGGLTPAALRAANIATGPFQNIGAAINGRLMSTVDQDAVIAALRRDGYTPEQALQVYQRRQADTRMHSNSYAQSPEALADFGQNTQRLAQSITSEPGAAQTIGNDFLGQRSGIDLENLTPQTSMYQRLNDALRRAFRVSSEPNYSRAVNGLVEEQKALSDPAYRAARADQTQFDVGPILEQHLGGANADLVGRPREALETAVSLFRDPMRTTVNPMTTALQDRGLSAVARKTFTGTPERDIVTGLQNDLAGGQYPASSVPRQQRFQQALDQIDNLMQNASPRRYKVLLGVRNDIERTSNIAGRTQNIAWNSTLTSTSRFDSAKQALDDMIEVAQRAGENNQVRVLSNLKRDLVEHADLSTATTAGDRTSSPYYNARNIYSSRQELIDAAEQGRALLKGEPFAEARNFNAMTPAEQRMYRQGVAEEVRSMLARKKYGDDVTQMFRTPAVQEALEVAFPEATRSFNPRGQFNRLVAREQNMQKTYNMSYRGSDTARIKAGQQDFSNMSIFGRALRQIGSPEGALWVTLTEGLQHLTRMREADAIRTARLLFNSHRPTVERTLNLLQNRYGSNVALRLRRMMDNRLGALPGATGDVAALQAPQ